MLIAVLYVCILLSGSSLLAQTVFSDNFNRSSFTDGSSGGTPSTTYNFNLGSGNIATTLVGGGDYRIDITTGGGGAAQLKNFCSASLAGYGAPFNVTLSSNSPRIITWTFNMRTNTAVTGIPTQGAMGGGIDLCGNAGANIYGGSPNGYGVIFNSSATGGVALVRFTGGMNASVPIITQTNTISKTNFYSVRVTLNTATNLWSLYVRDDGSTGFADPASGVNTLEGTVTDGTYTSQANTNFGFVYTNTAGAGKVMSVDNYTVSTFTPCTGTPAAGTVTASQVASCVSPYTSALSLSGTASDPGISYQWENSPDSSAWALVAGATNSTYSANVTSSIFYRCRVTCSYSGSSAYTPGKKLAINPLPASITGSSSVCMGSSVAYTSTSIGGIWTSGGIAIATVGSTDGIVAGIAAGTANITYTLPTTCFIAKSITVNPLPATISGTLNVCVNSNVTLSNASGGGSWSSNNGGIAIVGSIDGIVSGVASGNAVITYTLPTTCYTTTAMTVNALPANITGSSDVCAGASTPLSSTSSGGMWSSGSTGIATVNSTSGSVTGVAMGTSAITYTLPTGCSVNRNITVNPLPATITGPQNVCVGSSVALSDMDAGGAWSSGNTNASVGSADGAVTGNIPGTSVITYQLPTGCITTATITVNPLPAAISGINDICVGNSILVSNADGGGTWSSNNSNISIGSGTGIVTGSNAGGSIISYTLTTGCVATAGITVNPLPAMFTGTLNVCEGGSTLLSGTGGGTWSGSNANVSVGSLTGEVSGISAGNSVITFTLSTGCFVTGNVTVYPLPAAITGPANVCPAATITLGNSSLGGFWSNDNSNASIGSASGVLTGISAGTTMVTYTLPTGCRIASVITIDPLPASISGDHEFCLGAQETFTNTSSGGSWSVSNANASVDLISGIVTGINAGTSVITYTLPTSCYITSSLTIDPLPGMITGDKDVCVNDITMLTNTGGGTWSAGNANVTVDVSTGAATGIAAGVTSITYTLPTGCITSTEVTVDPLPLAIAGTMSVCEGLSETLTNTGSGTWAVSNSNASIGSLSGIVTGYAAGTTIVTYTLPTGCITTGTFTVNQVPAAVTGTAEFCEGQISPLSNAVPGGNWSSDNTLIADIDLLTGEVTGIAGGIAGITYLLPTGCMVASSVTINALPDISGLTSSTAVAVCEGNPSQVTINASTLNGIFTITYDMGGANTATGITTTVSMAAGTGSFATPILIFPGTTHVTITSIANSSGCVSYPAVNNIADIEVNPLPDPISGTNSVCAGGITTLSNTGGGSWNSGNMSVATIDLTTGDVSGIAAGTTFVTYTLPTGCAIAVPFTVNPLPVAISGVSSVCEAAVVTLINTSTGGTWQSSDPLTADVDATSGVVTGVLAGTAIITYTLPTGCRTTREVTVRPLPIMPDPISGTTVVCASGAVTTLTNIIPGGVWSSNNSFIARINSSGMVTGVVSGMASITYSITNSCGTAYTTTIVTVNPLPAVPSAITGPASACVGAAVSFIETVAGGVWSNTLTGITSVSSSGMVSALAAGTDTIKYTITNSCGAASVSKTLLVNPLPVAGTITGPSDVCVGSVIILSAGVPGGTWMHSRSSLTIVGGYTTGVTPGIDTVKYTVSNSCGTAIAIKTITVNAIPDAGFILGSSKVCVGASTVLSSTGTGGSWSAVNGYALVSGGVVTGIAAGIDTIRYTVPGSCGTRGTATKVITVNPAPYLYSVSGGGDYCSGEAGVHVTANGSELGNVYSLYRGSVFAGTRTGTGTAIDFGLMTDTGTYTIIAANTASGCYRQLAGEARVAIFADSLPNVLIYTTTEPDATVGEVITFTAVVTNGLPALTYEWQLNGARVLLTTANSYTSNRLMLFNNDVIVCRVKSIGRCGDVYGESSVTVNLHNLSSPSIAKEASIDIKPNPGSGRFILNGTWPFSDDHVDLLVTDILGRPVFQNNIAVVSGAIHETFYLDEFLSAGSYLLTLRSAGGTKTTHIQLER